MHAFNVVLEDFVDKPVLLNQALAAEFRRLDVDRKHWTTAPLKRDINKFIHTQTSSDKGVASFKAQNQIIKPVKKFDRFSIIVDKIMHQRNKKIMRIRKLYLKHRPLRERRVQRFVSACCKLSSRLPSCSFLLRRRCRNGHWTVVGPEGVKPHNSCRAWTWFILPWSKKKFVTLWTLIKHLLERRE